ncbi:MAG: membrane protein insertion efficiency factor YidD [Fibrobacteria bacterium]
MPFAKTILKSSLVFLIRIYQALHGSFFIGCCRFEPTCSHYAVEAIETRGMGRGLLLTAFRIARCHPFCKGGWDPVPTAPPSITLRLSTFRRIT